MSNIVELNNPVLSHKLAQLRNKDTDSSRFRRLMDQISNYLGYRALEEIETVEKTISTPQDKSKCMCIEEEKIAFVSILRAGNGMVNGFLEALPLAKVGHIGLYREPTTLVAVEYYFKMPKNIENMRCFVLDPMLATGHTAVAAISRLKEVCKNKISYVCVMSSPEGIEYFQKYHPDVNIITAQIDKGLNDHKYIMPGLGDAGDRLYGTI